MLSIQTMAEGSNLYTRPATTSTSHYIKQMPTEDEDDTSETGKSPDNNIRLRSQQFVTIVRRFSLNPLLANSNDSTNEPNRPISSLNANINRRCFNAYQLNILAALNKNIKLKSILKNSCQIRSNSYPGLVPRFTVSNVQHSASLPGASASVNNKENNSDQISSSSNGTPSTSTILVKRVSFNDIISTRQFDSDDPVSRIMILCPDEHKEPVNEQPINTNAAEEISMKPLTSCQSTEDESKDDIDNKSLQEGNYSTL